MTDQAERSDLAEAETEQAIQPMEFLVHGSILGAAVIRPTTNQALELWIPSHNDGAKMFAGIVGRQCGATIQNGNLWVFRPIPMTFRRPDGTTYVENKMIALFVGPLPEDEFDIIRRGGLKVRLNNGGRAILVITPNDVVSLPPLLPQWVNLEVSDTADNLLEAAPSIEG